jgi:predicted permease
MGGSAGFVIVGRPMGPNDPGAHGNVRVISPAYFSTLHIPILRGRVFSETDRKGTQPVAMIDDVLARQYWPNQDPIGQRIAFNPKDPPITIVGLVKHARSSSLEDDGSEGCYFLPIAQNPSLQFSFAVRGSGASQDLVADMQAAVRAVDPNQPIYDLETMSERVDDSLLGRRFLVVLLSVFAGLALLLSALGLYGIVNYSVKLRFRELGIRLALGAQRRDLLRLILSQGIRLALAGIPIGVAGVLIAGRALSSVLYQISPLNPLTLLMTSLILAATVLAASYLPAQRTAAIDPMQSLREE